MPSASWIQRQLLPWYRTAHRPLPWRATTDPYAVWLSEVILQQTRVDQGLAYYQRFLQRWPRVQDLAGASEEQVLKQWQGLGYYSRARNLLAAARQVMHDHGGRFPDTYAGLRQLKGVGDYTASAVASICFNRAEAVVDGNVYRVLARCFGISTPIDSAQGRKQFKALATSLLHPGHPGDHNQAVMELGATVCKPRNALCDQCPLQAGCAAFNTGRTGELPIKAGKAKTRDRFFNYLHIPVNEQLYTQKRGAGDIWQGLFELPLIESERPLRRHNMLATLNKTFGPGWKITAGSERPAHVLSHQVIHATFWRAVPPKAFSIPAHWHLMPLENLRELAFPRLLEKWIDELS